MKRRMAVYAVVSVLIAGQGMACAAVSFGFGTGVPWGIPVQWADARSYIQSELYLDDSLTGFVVVDTQPVSFPNSFGLHATLAPKAWLGPVSLYAGGGFSLGLTRVADRWLLSPAVHLVAGIQVWVAEPLAFHAEIRNQEELPLALAFRPYVSLGASVTLGAAPRSVQRFDVEQAWILVGLAVGALLLYLPRS